MIRVRPATDADLPALHALVERAYRGDTARGGWTHEADLVEGPRLAPGELARVLVEPATGLLLAEDDDVVGCVLVRRVAGGPGYLGLLTVDPARQGSGLGDRLLRAGEAAGRALGAKAMKMTVIDGRRDLIAWYERRGWRRTGERQPFPVATARPLEFLVLEKGL